MLQVDELVEDRLIDSLKTDGDVKPSGRRVAAIPEVATTKVIPFFCRSFERSSIVMNILPIPPSTLKIVQAARRRRTEPKIVL